MASSTSMTGSYINLSSYLEYIHMKTKQNRHNDLFRFSHRQSLRVSAHEDDVNAVSLEKATFLKFKQIHFISLLMELKIQTMYI